MKKIAVMQPYLFPYIGYIQLINAVDRFIVFDDVNYITRGWINRNYILVNREKKLFTVPLKKVSQNKLIKDVDIVSDLTWKRKFLKTLRLAYSKTPFFDDVFPIIRDIVDTQEEKLSKFITGSLMAIIKILNIKTDIVPSSRAYGNRHLKGKDRLIDICKKEEAGCYINPIGGQELYEKNYFEENGIALKFIKTKEICYSQFGDDFIPALSIIDVLMFNSIGRIQEFLEEYELL